MRSAVQRPMDVLLSSFAREFGARTEQKKGYCTRNFLAIAAVDVVQVPAPGRELRREARGALQRSPG